MGNLIFLGSKVEWEVVLHLFHGQPRERGWAGPVPLVLEVKSQGQLEVKLDCPALMGPTQGVVDVHVNLGRHRRHGRHWIQHSPLSVPSPFLPTHVPGCSERHVTQLYHALLHPLGTLAVSLSGSFHLLWCYNTEGHQHSHE